MRKYTEYTLELKFAHLRICAFDAIRCAGRTKEHHVPSCANNAQKTGPRRYVPSLSTYAKEQIRRNGATVPVLTWLYFQIISASAHFQNDKLLFIASILSLIEDEAKLNKVPNLVLIRA
jgi:hypothetical protein